MSLLIVISIIMIIINDNYHDVDCYNNMYMYDTESHKDYNDISNANGNDDAIMIIMIMIIIIIIIIIMINNNNNYNKKI